MSERLQITEAEIRQCLDTEELREWVQAQRWYASKSRSVTAIEVVETVILHEDPELLLLALVQTRFATGAHELYQLPLLIRAADVTDAGEPIAKSTEWAVYDALAAPEQLRELLTRIDADEGIETADGRFSFSTVDGSTAIPEDAAIRAIGVEQSNSSVVFGDRLVLKVFRKLEAGVNPELEVLRFLTRRGYPNIAALHGWYEYDGQALAATLGVAQTYLPAAVGGWELALDEITSAPEVLLDQLASLGVATAQMHNVLASDSGDPSFSPEQPSQESLPLLTATIDEDIERIFARLPDDERLEPIVGRGQDVRERLAARAQLGVGGRAIRTHGDYHLGQTLHTPHGWVIIDFEGEPARPLPERRQKRSPLRDVASMLRSFAYVTSAVPILRGRHAPDGFEQRARGAFLEQYLATVEQTLLPAGEAAVTNLLSVYELEKAIYEFQYELDNRPEWVPIPVSGIRRLLEE